MTWVWRELLLVAAAASLAVAVSPGSAGTVMEAALLLTGLLAAGASISAVFRELPSEPLPRPRTDRVLPRTARPQRLRDVEQASDLLVAVEYRLYPFLRQALLDVANHRLLSRHSVDFRRRPDRARSLLGEETWALLRPGEPVVGREPWDAVDLGRLKRVTRTLEEL